MQHAGYNYSISNFNNEWGGVLRMANAHGEFWWYWLVHVHVLGTMGTRSRDHAGIYETKLGKTNAI